MVYHINITLFIIFCINHSHINISDSCSKSKFSQNSSISPQTQNRIKTKLHKHHCCGVFIRILSSYSSCQGSRIIVMPMIIIMYQAKLFQNQCIYHLIQDSRCRFYVMPVMFQGLVSFVSWFLVIFMHQ